MKKAKTTDLTNRLIIVILALLFIGVVVVAGSTSVYSQSIYGDPYKFTFLQIGWVVLGMMGFYFFYKFDYKKLEKISYALFLTSVVFLLILAFVGFLVRLNVISCNPEMPFTPCKNGAVRWFYINSPPLPEFPVFGVLGFQPSELAKLSLVLYLATQLTKNIKRKEDPFLVYIVISGLLSGLVLLQPNMSMAVMLFLLGSMIFFATDVSIKKLLMVVPIILLFGTLLVFTSPYRRERLMALTGMGESSASYHMQQILISLGSGGLFGVGFGKSMQKFHYLPEIASDSIFAIIGEEFGLVGTTIILALFGYLIYLGFMISARSDSMIGRLLAVGVTSWIGLQFFVNAAAMTGLIPLTGVPVPLISYGGSSMVFSLMGLGILASVSKETV